ncbi:cilia- and flagella-associated protein 74-like [Myotis daubentonii]|uniref:cilia- and flagella-associated protein 74-like n=1 Tax=Myotis daubentonii TaxID=98922 RepID=UPI0028734A3A|nr:cilia- and flagella-associated protein 74-like [Myotis daubentonii]
MESAACLSPEVELLDVPLVEDERDELEDPEFKVETPPPGAEGGVCLGSRPGGAAKAEAGEKRSVLDRAQALVLRRDLGRLAQLHKEKDLLLQRTRGELRASQRMDLLTRQQQRMKAKEANHA